MDSQEKSVENRLLAALAHGSVVAQGLGVIVGVVIYIFRRDSSTYTAFQALQAAIYQLVNLVIVAGVWMVWLVFYLLTLIPVIQQAQAFPDAAPPPIFWIGLWSMFIPLGYMLLVILYGLWGALRCWQGRDFRYLLLGSWLERSGLWNESA